MTIPVSSTACLQTDTVLNTAISAAVNQIYMVALVGIIVIPTSSDLRKERAWHITFTMLAGAACFGIIMGVNSRKVQYAFLCLGVAFIFANPPLVLVWTSNIIAWPAEKRAITQAFVNAMG